MDGMSPGIGHNSNDSVTLDPEMIRDQLGIDHAAMLKRRDDLLAGYTRWCEKFANGIDTQDAAARTTDFVKQVKEVAREAENHRKIQKAPYDAAASAVQAFFNAGITERLKTCTTAMERALTLYARRVEDEARRKAALEAEERRLEAERLAVAARKAKSADLMDEAVAVADQADAALKTANASAADLTRTRGDLGGVSSVASRWTYEVEDLMTLVRAVAEGRAPLRYLAVAESVVGPEVRGKTGVRDIPGLRIFEDKSVRVR